MNSSSTIRFILPLVLTALLVVTSLYAFRHVFLTTDTYQPTHGDWDYLWDDAKNFYNNAHMKRPAFTLANIRWAWSADGQILGVWEPVSLMVKMIIHDVLDFSAARVAGGGGGGGDNEDGTTITEISGPRLYRMLSACWHTFNVVLAFWVGLMFVRAVNDYDYVTQQLNQVKEEGKMKTNGGGQSTGNCKTNSKLDQRGKKDNGKKAQNGQCSSSATDAGAAKAAVSYLYRHEVITTIGLFLGTSTFFAVHPLQAQTIGWISCLSYILSCTFALISFWGYVAHRDIMRKWRRHLRAGGRRGEVRGPYALFGVADSSAQQTAAKKKRLAGRSLNRLPSEERNEAMHWTLPKLISLFSYVCATFCKSPAVTLPLVFIIVDVFIYSYPLSSASVPIKEDANGKGKKNNAHERGTSLLLPNQVLGKFRKEAFPKLWNLTWRSIITWLPFLLTSFIVTVFVVKGNTKHLLDVQTPFEKVQKSVWALCWYATKIVYPSHLVAAVEKMSFSFLDHWEVAVALVAVPYITLALLACSTSSAFGRIMACSYGCFVAILLPSLGLIQHGRLFLAADRYAYLPLLIFGPLVAALFGSFYTAMSSLDLPLGLLPSGAMPLEAAVDSGSPVRRDLSAVTQGASGIPNPSTTARRNAKMLLLLSCLGMIGASGWFASNVTPETLLPWRNSMLLWAKNAEIFPETENAHVNLSAAYVNSGNPSREDLEKGLSHSKKALDMRPDSAKYKANLGILYGRLAKYDIAIPFLQKSLQEHPLTRWSPLMHKILAQCLDRTGRFEEAKKHYDTAIHLGEKSAQSELQKMMGKIRKSDPERAKKLESN